MEQIFDFFKRGADWLNISEHKIRLLLKWSARGRQVFGDKTRPEADAPALCATSMLSRGMRLLFPDQDLAGGKRDG